MISKLSDRIVENLLKRSVIQYEEKELYSYGLFMMISYIAFFLISMLVGIVLKISFSSILFYISFCLVRSFAGGIHANSEIKCTIITTVSILISEILIKIFIDYSLVQLAVLLVLMSSICLCVSKPVVSSQKTISKEEHKLFHKRVVILTLLIAILSIISMFLEAYSITISLAIGLSLANVLQVAGKLQHQYHHFIKLV